MFLCNVTAMLWRSVNDKQVNDLMIAPPCRGGDDETLLTKSSSLIIRTIKFYTASMDLLGMCSNPGDLHYVTSDSFILQVQIRNVWPLLFTDGYIWTWLAAISALYLCYRENVFIRTSVTQQLWYSCNELSNRNRVSHFTICHTIKHERTSSKFVNCCTSNHLELSFPPTTDGWNRLLFHMRDMGKDNVTFNYVKRFERVEIIVLNVLLNISEFIC